MAKTVSFVDIKQKCPVFLHTSEKFCSKSVKIARTHVRVSMTLGNSACIYNKNPAYGRQRISRRVRLVAPRVTPPQCTVGWTENTQKPEFFEKRKKSLKMRKLKKSRDMPILAIRPSTRGL